MDKKEKLIPFTKELLLKVERYRQKRMNESIRADLSFTSISFRQAVVELLAKGLEVEEKEEAK